ncbi:MAG: beta-lactamase family protein [Betaproteobacteria bacterium]|nr:beta-lactamase family protein [Betaproteobacteria bacterium]
MGCAHAPQRFSPQSLGHIESAIERAMVEKRFPGASLWIERDGVHAAHHRGKRTDQADASAIDANTIFDVASLTKVIVTATAVQLVIDEGKLTMETRLVDVLPACAGGGRNAITLAHMLTHTSGLPAGIAAKPAWSGKEEALRRACMLIPTDPPGTAFRYSDVNFILLGAIVERVSGESLDTFAQRRIFAPLGMTRSGYLPLARFSANEIAPTQRIPANANATLHIDLAPGMELAGVVHDPTARFMGGVAGHAGLFSTAADLARFARMLLSGGNMDGRRFLSRAAIERLTTVQSPPAVKEKRSAGWDVDSSYSRPRGALFSNASFGHTGFTGCAMWIEPASNAFYVLLTNRVYPDDKSVILPMYSEIGTLAAEALGLAR